MIVRSSSKKKGKRVRKKKKGAANAFGVVSAGGKPIRGKGETRNTRRLFGSVLKN